MLEMGLERPLREHAGGMFVGRGRVLKFKTHPDGCGLNLNMSENEKMLVHGIFSKSSISILHHRKKTEINSWLFAANLCNWIKNVFKIYVFHQVK